LPKEAKRDTIAKRSASRPSALEIATNPALAGREEPVDATLEPPELQPYYGETELSDNMKSKWDRLMAQSEDDKNPVYFEMETKKEFTAVTTQSLAEIPTTELVEELRL